MSQIIEWLKGNPAPDDYVEVSEINPFPVNLTSAAIETPIDMRDQNNIIRSGSRQGKLIVSTTPLALNVGGASLSDRHTLTVINDSSALLYIGFNDDVSPSDGIQLSSGIGVNFHFDPAELVEVYGVTIENSAEITVIELK